MAGRATGERIELRRRAKVIEGASKCLPVTKIAAQANVTRSTASAIIERESGTIAQRKERLTDLYASIAQRGAERIHEGLEQAPYGSLVVITGMSTDKLIALTTDPQSQLNNHIHVHLEKVDLIGQFNQAMRQLSNGATVSEKHLPSEKQISAKEIEDKPVQSNT